jgi:hypothetical protein
MYIYDNISLNPSQEEKYFIINLHIKSKHTFFVQKNFFPRKSCRLWDNVEKYGTAWQATDDNIIRRMRFTCWITKATDTHPEYVIFIAFPHQQWLRERASMLRLYVHCLSCFIISVKKIQSLAFIGKNTARSGLTLNDQLLGQMVYFQTNKWVMT